MAEIPERCTPEQILCFIESFIHILNELRNPDAPQGFRPDPLDSEQERAVSGELLTNLNHHVGELAEYLKREAVLRNIPADALLTFQARWGKLFRVYPGASDAIPHFPEYLEADLLIEAYRVTDTLRIKAEEELRNKLQSQTPEKAETAKAMRSQGDTPDAPSPKTRKEHQLEWLAQAMLMVRDHPDWSDAEIARRVRKNAGTLSRSREYQDAAKLARGSKTDRPKGFQTVDPDSGLVDVEAVAPPAAPADDRSE